ncbi:MAG: hypothetical protein U0531_01125 [Dehalococcoidia bacterium]
MQPADIIALLLIIGVRGLVPLLVLRWPFWGALLCIGGDAFDTFILDILWATTIKQNYHLMDKFFDTYYLGFEAWVAYRRWVDPLARRTALALYGLRLGAAILFELTHIRQFFFIGANVFENFYIYVAGRRELDPDFRVGNARRLALTLLFVGAPKLLQEYVMHYRQSETWWFVRTYILHWR